MGNPNSVADVLDDWQSLLTAVREDAALLPNVEPHRAALEQAHTDALATKGRRDLHNAGKQQATQDLRTQIRAGKELAIRLRGAVRADMGPRSERLVHYQIAPLRKHSRKSKTAPETPAPDSPKPPQTPPPASFTGPLGLVKDVM